MAKKVVIDAGHGGSDSGAIGNGIIEKNLTLDISKYMYDRLKELGVPVKLTRDSDVDLPASERPQRVFEQYERTEFKREGVLIKGSSLFFRDYNTLLYEGNFNILKEE